MWHHRTFNQKAGIKIRCQMLNIRKWDYTWKKNRFYSNFQLILLWDCLLHMDAEGADIWRFFFFFFPPVSSAFYRPEQLCWHVGPGMLFEMATDSWLPGRDTNYLLCIVKWLPTGLCWWSVYLEMFFPCGCLQILAVIGMRVASDIKVHNGTKNQKTWHWNCFKVKKNQLGM